MKRVKVDKSFSRNYFQYEKTILFDKSLSLKAKGLHALLMALGDKWEFSMAGLITMCKESRDSVYVGIAELEAKKYVKREKLNTGHVNYIFYEIPYDSPLFKANTDFPYKPNTENPDQENPDQAFPTLLRDNNNIKIDNSIQEDKGTSEILRFYHQNKRENFVDLSKISEREKSELHRLQSKFSLQEIKDIISAAAESEYYQDFNLVKFANIFKEENAIKLLRGEFKERKKAAGRTIVNPYKSWNAEEFKAECQKYKKEFGAKVLTDFFRYWNQPTETGIMRFQEKNAWDTEQQLKIWRTKQQQYSKK